MQKIKPITLTALEDLADKLTNVQWHGEYFACSCAFHSPDTRPSMMVYTDGYNCLGCGAHGSIQYLAKKLNSVNTFIVQVPQTGKVKPNWYSWLRAFGTWEYLVLAAHRTVINNPQYRNYFIDRKINSYIDTCNLGYIDGWYVFPVYDTDHTLLTIIVRAGRSMNTDAKYVLRPRQENEENHLYIPDWKLVNDANELYVPFGIIDAVTLCTLGLPSATGTVGKSFNPALFDEFRCPIWIIPDRGEDKEATGLCASLGWRGRLLRLEYPEVCKDSNDIACKHGSEVLLQLIEKAKEECTQTLHQKEH